MKFAVELAGITIKIESIFDSTKEFCKDYLTDNEASVEIAITQKDIEVERDKNTIPDYNFSDEYLETLAVYRKVAEELVEQGILLFHGSCLSVDGKGYLFTAPSGTGKSTHTRLWRKVLPQMGKEVIMVNDDKPLIKITDNDIIVYGTPWNGKHGLSTNISVPIKGICVINRGEKNKITQISKNDAWKEALKACYRPSNALKTAKTVELIDAITSRIPFYILECNMEDEAAIVSYNGMSDDIISHKCNI